MYTTVRGLPGAETKPAGKVRASLRRTVSGTVVLLGVTSLLTDLSSEMVAAILPIYLTLQIGLSPLGFGLIDGLYSGATVVARLAAGYTADRTRRPKAIAAAGYGLSAICKLFYLPAASVAAISSVVAVDRTGKGIRTAPRDALIAGASKEETLGVSFGVHRALDTVGAMLGPLVAFAILFFAPQNGFKPIFVISFAFAILGLAVLVLFVREQPREQVTAPKLRLADIRKLTQRRGFVQILIAAGLLATLTISDNFLYLVLLDRGELPFKFFPLLFVGQSLVYLALAIPFGRLADRIGRGKVFVGGYVALLGAYFCAASAPGWLAIAGCLGLLGVYYAATDGVLSALAVPFLPHELRSTGLALLLTVIGSGRFVASIGFGLVWTMLGMSPAVALMGAGLLVAVPIAARILRVRHETELS